MKGEKNYCYFPFSVAFTLAIIVVVLIIGVAISTLNNLPATLEYCEENPDAIISSIHPPPENITCREYIESLAVMT